jgi:nitrite reductase (NO-forming)
MITPASLPTGGGRGAGDRVRRSHAQTRATLRMALAFIAAAAVAAAVDSARWLPVHLFLAGAVMLAISGVSLMLTVTWSAAPAPADRWVAAQRFCIAAGAAGVVFGRRAQIANPWMIVPAVVYSAGVVLLAVLLLVTARRGVERRFDPAVAAYVTALAFGMTGVAYGAWMAVGEAPAAARTVHVTLNLLGLVGLVVGGTMPFFAATVGRTKMAKRARRGRLVVGLGWQAATLLLAAVALAAEVPRLAAVGLAGYAIGVLAVMHALPRPSRRQLEWAGPRLVALWAGGLWWATAVGATALDAAADRGVFGDRWLVVLVVAGYGQILWGSLAYLLPMLRGGGHARLSEGFASTRSWLGLAAANAAGLSAAAAAPGRVTALLVAVWVIDSGWRAARVGTTRAARPDAP